MVLQQEVLEKKYTRNRRRRRIEVYNRKMREDRDRQWHNNEIVNRIGLEASLLLQLADRPTDRPEWATMRERYTSYARSTKTTRPNVKLDSLLIISTSSLFIQFQYMNFSSMPFFFLFKVQIVYINLCYLCCRTFFLLCPFP